MVSLWGSRLVLRIESNYSFNDERILEGIYARVSHRHRRRTRQLCLTKRYVYWQNYWFQNLLTWRRWRLLSKYCRSHYRRESTPEIIVWIHFPKYKVHFIVSPSSFILTQAHLIPYAQKLKVWLILLWGITQIQSPIAHVL